MKVALNGEEREFPQGATVDDAVMATGAPGSRAGVAVAVDGQVVPRTRWGEVLLEEGHRIEVVQAVQGG